MNQQSLKTFLTVGGGLFLAYFLLVGIDQPENMYLISIIVFFYFGLLSKINVSFCGRIFQKYSFLHIFLFHAIVSFLLITFTTLIGSMTLDSDAAFLESLYSAVFVSVVVLPVILSWSSLTAIFFGQGQKNVIMKANHSILFIMSFGVILFLSSSFLSFRSLPLDPHYNECDCSRQYVSAIGGFPLQIFEFPKVGSGRPEPVGWKIPFLGNFVFWLAIAYVSNFSLREKALDFRLIYVLTVCAIFFSCLGALSLVIMFD